MVTASLNVLLERVKIEESHLHGVKKSTLLQIALYVLGNKYLRREYNEAISVLAKYHLWKLVDKRRPRHCRELIEVEIAKPYSFRCCRCGWPISSKKSLEIGLGYICRRKTSFNAEYHVHSRMEDQGRERGIDKSASPAGTKTIDCERQSENKTHRQSTNVSSGGA